MVWCCFVSKTTYIVIRSKVKSTRIRIKLQTHKNETNEKCNTQFKLITQEEEGAEEAEEEEEEEKLHKMDNSHETSEKCWEFIETLALHRNISKCYIDFISKEIKRFDIMFFSFSFQHIKFQFRNVEQKNNIRFRVHTPRNILGTAN